MSNDTINPKHYHTNPCRKCGSTLRLVSNKACVSCKREYQQKYRKTNPEKVREIDNRWRRNNPEKVREYHKRYKRTHKEKVRAYNKHWNENNREKRREFNLKWQKANPAKIQARNSRWAKANPEKVRARWHRRRTKILNGKSEPYDFKAICNHYDNRCLGCGKKKKLTRDHIKPIAIGGDDVASNIQPLCGSCNSSKGARHIDYRPDAGPERWTQKKLF